MEVNAIFSTDEINQLVTRILNSSLFRNSRVLSRFLEFIISETLHKNEVQIKEYSIAIHVLDRPRNFSPNSNAIVRIHAGRLRRALTDYYLTVGMYEPIIIHIPKGCYVPEFVASGTGKQMNALLPALPQKSRKPLVAIFPLRIFTHKDDIGELYTLLEAQLSEELLRFPDITVVAHYSKEMEAKIKENVLEAGRFASADYIITGRFICIGEHIRVLLNLLATTTGEVLLCKSFDKNTLLSGILEIQDGMVQDLIAFADGCYRFIFQERQKLLTDLCQDRDCSEWSIVNSESRR